MAKKMTTTQVADMIIRHLKAKCPGTYDYVVLLNTHIGEQELLRYGMNIMAYYGDDIFSGSVYYTDSLASMGMNKVIAKAILSFKEKYSELIPPVPKIEKINFVEEFEVTPLS